MTAEPFTTPGPEIPRDRWGRPMIVPEGGGRPVPYTRCTTFVGVMEDTFGLTKWQIRNVITGLIERPDLLLKAKAGRADTATLNAVADEAQEAAKAHASRNIGTALHQLAEQVDRGEDVGQVPDDYRADLDAYREETSGLTMVEIETFGVIDDLKVGGTWDRVVDFGDGQRHIADIKTGKIDHGIGKIAMQLAVYARATPYTADGTRHPRGPATAVDQDAGLIIHLPAGTGTCTLHWVDLQAGWEGVQLAAQVRDWRGRKGLTWTNEPAFVDADPISRSIAAATTVQDLTLIWSQNQDRWDRLHTDLAKARRALIEAGAA